MTFNKTRKVELSARVYSIVHIGHEQTTDPYDEAAQGAKKRVEAYLYDHTSIVSGYTDPGDGRHTTYVLCTTATDTIVEGDVYTPGCVQRAFHLANYQVERLFSGLIPGQVIGAKDDAIEAAVDHVLS